VYQVQPTPDDKAILDTGATLYPLVTLKDEHGGIAHIIKDDSCYVLTTGSVGGRVCMTPWWFREAFEAGRHLPPLSE